MGALVAASLAWSGFLALASAISAPAMAQEPSVAERVTAVVAAFEQVAHRAEGGDWQAADAAYNMAIAVADAERLVLEAEVEDPARAAMANVDALLPELIQALDGEDAAAVGAVVGLIRGELRAIAPGAIPAGPPEQSTLIVLGWQDQMEVAMSAAASGDWRTARDTATVLHDSTVRTAPSVAAVVGPGLQSDLDVLRVFALRLRAAALDRSLEDATAVRAVLERHYQRVLDAIRGVPPAPPTADVRARMHFRPFLARAEAGEVVRVPLMAEEIPDVGLGSFEIRVRWSASALELTDVRWEAGQGETERGEPGEVELSLPQAPTGPRGDAVVAELLFLARGAQVQPRDYLPAAEVAEIETAVESAKERATQGDIPIAGNVVMDAYLGFTRGADRPGSLHRALSGVGAAIPLETALLRALEAVSEPAATDVIVERLNEARGVLDAAIASYASALSIEHGVPIIVETLRVTDTRGQLLATAPNVPGAVDVSGLPAAPDTGATVAPAIALESGGPGSGLDATRPATAGTAVATPGGGEANLETEPTGAHDAEGAPAPAAGGARLPLPVLLAVAISVIAGSAAVVWARSYAD